MALVTQGIGPELPLIGPTASLSLDVPGASILGVFRPALRASLWSFHSSIMPNDLLNAARCAK